MSKDKLILSYFGTLGLSQNVSITFPYAAKIQEIIKDFEYLIIGDGARADDVKSSAQIYDFIHIMPGMPPEKLEPYYAKTLLSVVVLNKSENFKYTIPSKLFQVMGRGVAVLFIGPDGESAEIVRDSNAGIVLTGTFDEDIKILSSFFLRPDWQNHLQTLGKNGARTVKEKYSRKHLAQKYLEILESVRQS